MKKNFLNKRKLAMGIIGNILEKIYSPSRQGHKNGGIYLLKTQGKESEKNVFINNSNKISKSLIKEIFYRFKTLSYYQLYNEYSVFQYLSKYLKDGVYTPQVINFKDTGNKVILETEYIKGKTLEKYSDSFQQKTLKKVISSLANITAEKDLLPKRTPGFIFLTSFLYFVVVIIKDPKLFIPLSKLYMVFFYQYSRYIFSKPQYVITHKDLDPRNILISKNKVFLLDMEVVCNAEKETDISLIARYYFQSLQKETLFSLVKYFIKTDESQRKFVALTIFYTIQILAIEKKNTEFYEQAKEYISFMKNELFPSMGVAYKTMGEYLYDGLMNVTVLVNNIFGRKTTPFIICYHSISNDNWRFSTPIKSFEDQMRFLNENYDILPLEKIVNSKNKKAVAITFDDGYEDFLKNAFPILRRYQVPATLFVLGSSEHANRHELKNDKKLLSKENIKLLHKKGITIGFHTNTHANLAEIPYRDIITEIEEGKYQFEKETKIKLKYFAYPRGIYTKHIADIVKHAGFEAGFTVDCAPLQKTNMYLIPRLSLEGKVSMTHFKASTSTIGILFGNVFMKVLKRKEQLFSHNRRKIYSFPKVERRVSL